MGSRSSPILIEPAPKTTDPEPASKFTLEARNHGSSRVSAPPAYCPTSLGRSETNGISLLSGHRSQVVPLDANFVLFPRMPSQTLILRRNEEQLIGPNVCGLRRAQISRTFKV